MKRSILIFASVLYAILAIASPGLAGQKGSTIPTEATFRNNCQLASDCDPALPYDRIGSDRMVPYPYTYLNGSDEVKVVIDSSGEFILDTNTNSGRIYRSLYVDISDPVSPGQPFPPAFALGYGWVDAYVVTQAGGLSAMVSGSSHFAGLAVNFPGWSLRFGLPPGEQDTSLVQVTCVGPAPSGSPCDTWELEAAPTAVAKLLSVSSKGQTKDYGNFYMPFKVTVHKLTR
jgi:hypothetical protein